MLNYSIKFTSLCFYFFSSFVNLQSKAVRNGTYNKHRESITLVLRRRAKDRALDPTQSLVCFFPAVPTWCNIGFPASRTGANCPISVQSLLPFLGGT